MGFLAYCLAILLLILTLPGTIELFFLTLGAIFGSFRKNHKRLIPGELKGVIIIPAHNEEIHIEDTLKAIQQCEGNFDCVVIADNCTDSTAEICQKYHVKTFERKDELNRGKAYALDYAFQKLLSADYDWFAIVDADSHVQSNFVSELNRLFSQKADAVQVRYSAENSQKSIKTRLMCIAFLAFNYVRPKGRQFWNLSSGILGTGFALSRQTLQAVPYQIDSIVEDLAYHLRIVQAGYKVQFTELTKVTSDLPVESTGAKIQRTRWEGGRFALMREAIPKLFLEVAKGRWKQLEPLLDLLLLPLAYHVLLLIILLFINPFQTYALVALSIVLGHIITALIIGGGSWKDLAALLLSPFYILWKIFLLPKTLFFSHKSSEWVRTKRTPKR